MQFSIKFGLPINSNEDWPLEEGEMHVHNDTKKTVSIWWYDLTG